MRITRRLFAHSPLSLALLLILSPAMAETVPPAHDHQPVDLNAVQVQASPLAGNIEDIVRPVDVLAGDRLNEAKANSLGETVSKLPGVQSSYFGPGVGRPIIRGFDGARVQVLSSGMGSGDVSTVSVDHAVGIEPFLADQIEVLKGPATLLYGSGAIGGAVNVVDGRVPEAVTEQPLQGRAELRGNTVNGERTGMMRLDGTAASGRWVMHADALHRETHDYAIPGFAESAAHRAETGETPDPTEAGTLPNSFLRTDSGALGLTWVGERGFVGVGANLFDTRYGVPSHEDEPVSIHLDQRRHELHAGLNDLGPFASLRLRLASSDYNHAEMEGQAVGTVFKNTSHEGRLELVHKPWAGWKGALGLQASQRDFVAIGDEAFVPATKGSDAGVFWIGEREFDLGGHGPLKLEIGARHDRNQIETDANLLAPDRLIDRTFQANSASASLRWNLAPDFHLSFGLDRAQRVPTAEELYSNGLHVATGSIELGNDRLDPETANRVELGGHWHRGPLKLSLSAYLVRYSDFIYLSALESAAAPGTPLLVDATPVNLWTQGDARFHGVEAEAQWRLADNDSGAWDLRVFGDQVRARLEGQGQRAATLQVFHGDHADRVDGLVNQSGNLPRIAPMRVGGELRWEREGWRASLGAVRYARQDQVAAGESATPGYTLVDAHVAWHIDTAGGNGYELFVDGNNLLNEEARVHTSFLKALAPLPGRGLTFGIRALF